MTKLTIPSLAVAAALLLGGCGGTMEKVLPDQSLQYKEQREASENLELPPDLAGASFDDALDIPGVTGTATYSSYAGERAARTRIAQSGDVLPDVEGVSLRRAGDRRWLDIDAPPAAVWPEVVDFWRQQGILLVEQNPATGVMRTDWLENRAEVRQDFVTRQVRKVLDGLYSTSTRDQYRVRIDAGPTRDSTEVYLAHTGMEERLVRNTVGEGATTVWEPAGSDPDKEAIMLRRLMLYLGVSDRDADRMLASGGSAVPAGAGSAAAAAAGARLVGSGDNAELVIPGEYRQAWRRTGLALDRSGFAVADRNRSEGVFYVRYDDPGRDAGRRRGIVDRVAFWRGNEDGGVEQYQIRLDAGADETRVRVLDADGRPTTSGTSERILSLLQDELR